jgi:hypothetical protein
MDSLLLYYELIGATKTPTLSDLLDIEDPDDISEYNRKLVEEVVQLGDELRRMIDEYNEEPRIRRYLGNRRTNQGN